MGIFAIFNPNLNISFGEGESGVEAAVLSKLHIQMVCGISIGNVIAANKIMKQCLEWLDANSTPAGHHVYSIFLRGTGIVGI